MFFPCASVQDFFHLRQREIAFFLLIVKMRRNANPGLRAIVHQNVSRQQFAADFEGVWAIDRHGAGALYRILRSVDMPAACASTLENTRGHSDGFFANGRRADLIENFEAGPARVKRRNVRRSVQKTVRIVARIDDAGFELKWTAMREPTRQCRAQFLPQILANVEIGYAGTAAKPLEHASDGKIGAKFSYIEWHSAGRLEYVKNHMRADAVSFLDDGFGVDDE